MQKLHCSITNYCYCFLSVWVSSFSFASFSLSVFVSLFCTFFRNVNFILLGKLRVHSEHPQDLLLQQRHLEVVREPVEGLQQVGDVVHLDGGGEVAGALAALGHVVGRDLVTLGAGQVLQAVAHHLPLQGVDQHGLDVLMK